MRRLPVCLIIVPLALACRDAALMSPPTSSSVLEGMTDLGTLPGDDWSSACCITDDGRILGVSGSSSVSTSQGTTVIWSSDGTITALEIPLLPGAAWSATADDFNERGDVVGSDVFAAQHAWIWSEAQGKYDITANVPGGSFEGAPSAVDGNGLVLGTNNSRTAGCYHVPSCWRPFLWSYETGYRELGTPDADSTARASANGLSDGPTVVGLAMTDALGMRPFFWKEGEGFTILPTLAGGYAMAVNRAGNVVGVAWDPALQAYQATAWPRSGGAIRLSPDDTNTQIALAINDMDMAVGWSAQSEGGNHATLWVLSSGTSVLALGAARTAARTPVASARMATAVAASRAATACLSDTDALVSRGTLLACFARSR